MLRKRKHSVELPLFAEARVHPQPRKRRLSRFTWATMYLSVMVALFCGVFYPLAIREYDELDTAYAASQTIYSKVQPPAFFAVGHPTKIEVPSVGINIPVVDGVYNEVTNSWTLNHDKVQFDTSSTQPNSREGNTFIYGHATSWVFGSLLKIQPDALAYVTTENGYVFTYKLTGHTVVDPTNVEVLKYTGPSRLMLQTCTGPTLSEFRQLFYFDYVSRGKAL